VSDEGVRTGKSRGAPVRGHKDKGEKARRGSPGVSRGRGRGRGRGGDAGSEAQCRQKQGQGHRQRRRPGCRQGAGRGAGAGPSGVWEEGEEEEDLAEQGPGGVAEAEAAEGEVARVQEAAEGEVAGVPEGAVKS